MPRTQAQEIDPDGAIESERIRPKAGAMAKRAAGFYDCRRRRRWPEDSLSQSTVSFFVPARLYEEKR